MITISEPKQVGKQQLFDVTIDGTVIKDCKLAEGKNGTFVSGPSRSYVAKDGTTKWVNLATFSNDHQSEIKAILQGAEVPIIDVNSIDDEDVPF